MTVLETYQAGETITLTATVTPDGEGDLSGVTAVTVSAKNGKTTVLDAQAMTKDNDLSTLTSYVYKYDYTIPTTVEGKVQWWVTVTNTGGYKTINKGEFYSEVL